MIGSQMLFEKMLNEAYVHTVDTDRIILYTTVSKSVRKILKQGRASVLFPVPMYRYCTICNGVIK